jgi:hypothetical protein
MFGFIWKIRAAYRFRQCMGGWGYLDLRLAWRTADVCYDVMIESGDYTNPADAIDEELSCWDE